MSLHCFIYTGFQVTVPTDKRVGHFIGSIFKIQKQIRLKHSKLLQLMGLVCQLFGPLLAEFSFFEFEEEGIYYLFLKYISDEKNSCLFNVHVCVCVRWLYISRSCHYVKIIVRII